MSLATFDAGSAFDQAFDAQLADAPEGVTWQATGRPTKAHPHGEDVGWWRTEGPEMVRRWVQWREETPWEIWVAPGGELGVELGLEVVIDGELVKLYIDRVFATAPDNQRPVILDLKSGGMAPSSLLQLGLYKCAIEIIWPEVKVAGGTYWMARKGETTGVSPLDQFSPRYIGTLLRRLKAIRSVGGYIPTVSNMCKSCKVGRFCAVNNGADSHVDPDFVLLGGNRGG